MANPRVSSHKTKRPNSLILPRHRSQRWFEGVGSGELSLSGLKSVIALNVVAETHSDTNGALAANRAGRTICLPDSGGERAASIYSLIGSAKLNGLDPEVYLREVLAAIPSIALKNCSPGTLAPINISQRS